MDFWKKFKQLLLGVFKGCVEAMICKSDFKLPGRKTGIGGKDEGRTYHRSEKCQEHQEDSF